MSSIGYGHWCLESLNYWHQIWITDVIKKRACWSRLPGEQVVMQVCKCGLPFSWQMFFFIYTTEKWRNLFSTKYYVGEKLYAYVCPQGLRKESWHVSCFMLLASEGCAQTSQTRLLHLPSPTFSTWNLAWATLARSCAAVATQHLTCLALSVLSGSPIADCGKWLGKAREICGDSRILLFCMSGWPSASAWAEAHSLSRKQTNQAVEFNLELYIILIVLGNLKKRHFFTVWSRYVGLSHDLSITEQHLELIIIILTTFLPCPETPFHFHLKKHFPFSFASWPGKSSTIQWTISYPMYA